MCAREERTTERGATRRMPGGIERWDTVTEFRREKRDGKDEERKKGVGKDRARKGGCHERKRHNGRVPGKIEAERWCQRE